MKTNPKTNKNKQAKMKKQLIQTNMLFTKHHRIEYQKLDLMRVY